MLYITQIQLKFIPVVMASADRNNVQHIQSQISRLSASTLYCQGTAGVPTHLEKWELCAKTGILLE